MTQSNTTIGNLDFNLVGQKTTANFRVLPLGIYDGILGMDWLTKNYASLHCREQNLSFRNNLDEEVTIKGERGKPTLHLVHFTKLAKTSRKGQQVYALKLNLVKEDSESLIPPWLSEFEDVFPEEQTSLPLEREVDHAIELNPGAKPVSKRPYKMSVPEAIELKE